MLRMIPEPGLTTLIDTATSAPNGTFVVPVVDLLKDEIAGRFVDTYCAELMTRARDGFEIDASSGRAIHSLIRDGANDVTLIETRQADGEYLANHHYGRWFRPCPIGGILGSVQHLRKLVGAIDELPALQGGRPDAEPERPFGGRAWLRIRNVESENLFVHGPYRRAELHGMFQKADRAGAEIRVLLRRGSLGGSAGRKRLRSKHGKDERDGNKDAIGPLFQHSHGGKDPTLC